MAKVIVTRGSGKLEPDCVDEFLHHDNEAIVEEAFPQVGVYCGMPAALDSFRIGREVFSGTGML
jgi:hypothetical protein